MKLEALMQTDVHTVKDSDSMTVGLHALREHKIKHLPVIGGDGKLAGIVTDRDLKRASASDATALEIHELLYLLDKVKLADVMSKNPVTAEPSTGVGAAARLMAEKRVGCLPICDGGVLKGMVTTTDLLNYLAEHESE